MRAVGSGVSAAPAAEAPAVFGSVPAFSLTSQQGETVDAGTLEGRPYVACAVFTTCVGPCPRIAAEMRALQEALEGTDVLLVSISVDPGHDSPEVLRAYAEDLGADPERWLFLTGPEEVVYPLVREGFKLAVQRAEPGVAVPGQQVTHGTQLVAVDREGRIRGWYDSGNADELERLRGRMRFLAAETTH